MGGSRVTAQVDRIAGKLRAARQGGFQPFGVQAHRFRINPPLPNRKVVAIEQRYRIEFPPGYRVFITCVANGGAGPAYGLYPLGKALKENGRRVRDDFFRTPFPYVAAYNPNKEMPAGEIIERIERGEKSEAEADKRHRAQRAGTLSLCDEGCGYLHFLVLSGRARGKMWIDGRCSDGGFVPLRVDFLGWYERWLDDTLGGGDGVWWMKD